MLSIYFNVFYLSFNEQKEYAILILIYVRVQVRFFFKVCLITLDSTNINRRFVKENATHHFFVHNDWIT